MFVDLESGRGYVYSRLKEEAKFYFKGNEITYLDDVRSAPSHFGDVDYARLELASGNTKRQCGFWYSLYNSRQNIFVGYFCPPYGRPVSDDDVKKAIMAVVPRQQ